MANYNECKISVADSSGALSADLPEHLSSRKEPYVGGQWQWQAVPQPVELWRWRACGNTLNADRSVQNGGQLLDCLTVAIYNRRHWKVNECSPKMKISPSCHCESLKNMDWNENSTHHKPLDWIFYPLPRQCWWQHRCIFLHQWCALHGPWAWYHHDWSWSSSSSSSITKSTSCKFHFSEGTTWAHCCPCDW